MAIGDDFSYSTVSKRISHDSGSTIYSVNAFYSWLQDEFDELVQMDDKIPISAQTPTAYTLLNGWFLDYGDASLAHEYLNGGAITTENWEASSDPIYKLSFQAGGYVSAIAGDIGKTVNDDAVDVGPLLGYNNTTRIWWVRDTNANGAVGSGSTIDIDDSGTGAGTTDAGSVTGNNLWTNLYTLGTLEGTPQLYITRDDSRISEWWSTGQIDVLILIKDFDTELGAPLAGGDTGFVQVFDRQWTDLWDWFEVDLGPGGRQAVPMATFDDLNNQTAEGTVATWSDVVVSTAGPYSRDIGDGNGVQNYDYSVECATRTLDQVYERLKYETRIGETGLIDGVEGQQYVTVAGQEGTYAPVKQAPFGSFAGGIFFGARGIWIENMDSGDTENYQLIDSAGTTRNPPTQAPISVVSVVGFDRVLVALSTGGASTVVDKNQYTISGTIASGAYQVDITVPVPADTPSSGVIRILDANVSEERYTYSGFGDHSFSLDNAATSKAYTGPADTAYVPYIDREVPSGSTSVQQSLTFATSRTLVARVRKKGIIPFETTANLVTGGVTITASRTTDTIVT
jgi:hypothetical protein